MSFHKNGNYKKLILSILVDFIWKLQDFKIDFEALHEAIESVIF